MRSFALLLALAGCAPALSNIVTARTLRPDEGQVMVAVEAPGLTREPARRVGPRVSGLEQLQVAVREGFTERWETGVRFSFAGIEWEQKLQLVRSPLDVAGIDVAFSSGIGAGVWELDEWESVVATRVRAELPIGIRLPDTSQVVLSPRVVFARWLPTPDSTLEARSALLVGGSAAIAWRLGSGYLVPEVTLLQTVSGPPAGDPLHADPVVVRAGLGWLFGG